MWLFTKFGFFSAVENRFDNTKSTIAIRARVQDDLQSLVNKYLTRDEAAKYGAIKTFKVSDYPYRIFLPKEVFSRVMSQIALDIDYDNFKSAVGANQGFDRESVYHEVWGTMLRLEIENRSKRKEKV